MPPWAKLVLLSVWAFLVIRVTLALAATLRAKDSPAMPEPMTRKSEESIRGFSI